MDEEEAVSEDVHLFSFLLYCSSIHTASKFKALREMTPRHTSEPACTHRKTLQWPIILKSTSLYFIQVPNNSMQIARNQRKPKPILSLSLSLPLSFSCDVDHHHMFCYSWQLEHGIKNEYLL